MSRVSVSVNKVLGVIVLVGMLLAACSPRAAGLGDVGAEQAGSATAAKADLRVQVVGLLEALEPDAATIDGTRLAINANTVVIDGLQPNQIVEAQSVLGSGGLAALIIQPAGPGRAAGQTFELTGVVESQSAGAWVVGGHTVQVNPGQTEVSGSPAAGDLVKVEGGTNAAGALLAREIQPATAAAGAPANEIEFSGTVTSIGASAWVIGGQTVQVTPQTEIKSGVALNAFVKVHAVPQADGSLVAREIEPDAPQATGTPPVNGDEHEFTGTLTAINADLWTIGGQVVRITPGTEVKGDPRVGDVVKVHASPGSDGVLVAREVELAQGDDDDEAEDDDNRAGEVEFTGTLTAVNGDLWTIAGQAVRVVGATEIKDTVQVGDEVKVHATAGTDGVLVAREIELAHDGSDDVNDDRSGSGSGGDGADDNSGPGSADDGGDDHSGSGGGDDHGDGTDDRGGDDHGGGNDDGGGDDHGGDD
jgi:hypothetical protein